MPKPPPHSLRILGIDPGSRFTGVGIIDHERNQSHRVFSETIKLPKDEPLHIRLVVLGKRLEQLVTEYQPQVGVIEQVFFATNAKSAITLGQARGVVLYVLAKADLPLHEYSATEVKNTVVGFGKAPKDQIQRMVQMLLNLRQASLMEDEADALAVALTHAHQHRWQIHDRIP